MEAYNNDSEDFDMDLLGDGVKFYGYDNEDGSLDLSKAFTKSSFKFDGSDDYIEIPCNTSEVFDTGVTFEFYGKFNELGCYYDYNNASSGLNNNGYFGIFNIVHKGDDENGYYPYIISRFGMMRRL